MSAFSLREKVFAASTLAGFMAVAPVAQTQPCRGHSKLRIGGANAQVGRERDRQSSADADAADHGDGGLQRGVEGRVRRITGLVVNLDSLGIAALLFEFRDVGPGHEGLLARPGQYY